MDGREPQADSARAPGEGDGPPTRAVEALLDAHDASMAAVAGRLHDDPVQQLVAAILLLEPTLGASTDPLVTKAVEAVQRAASSCRAIMAAIDPTRIGDVVDAQTELRALAARAGGEARVDLDAAAGPGAGPALQRAVRCAQDVVGDVVAQGRSLRSLEVGASAARVLVLVVAEGAGLRMDGPGVALACARAEVAGGTLVHGEGADRTHEVRIELPA